MRPPPASRRLARLLAPALALLVLSAVPFAEAAGLPPAEPAPYVPPAFDPPPAAIAGAVRHVYKTARGFELPLYVFAPAASSAAGPAPIVAFFHGSGWHSGAVIQFAGHARRLAALGVCAVLVEYRVKTTYDATPFDGVADAKSAVRWLRAHADGLRIDPRRVAVAGGSAGAHLALCAAVFDGSLDDPADDLAVSARPDLVVLFAAVTDTTRLESEPEPNPLFAGRELELSPIHHLKPGMPPVQIFQGSLDQYATPGRNRRFADALRANGDECDYILFEGRDHFFYNHPAYYARYPIFTPVRGRTDFDLCLLLLTRFLHAHGFLAAPPVVPDAEVR